MIAEVWVSGKYAEFSIKNPDTQLQVDAMIGEVLSAIPANQRANTVVVFTSDHGDLAMDRDNF